MSGKPEFFPTKKGATIAADFSALYFKEVYKDIASRLWNRHKIRIADHIDTLKEVKDLHIDGINFTPRDHKSLIAALTRSNFRHDDRKNLCDAVSSLATTGQGYRETGVPSLHCQISSGFCNIHVDTFGFVALRNGEKYYSPDAIQHIIDELGWPKVIDLVAKVFPGFAQALRDVHIIVPNLKIKYDPVVGARLDLKKGKGWKLGIESTRSFYGKHKGETKHMVTLEFEL